MCVSVCVCLCVCSANENTFNIDDEDKSRVTADGYIITDMKTSINGPSSTNISDVASSQPSPMHPYVCLSVSEYMSVFYCIAQNFANRKF